MNINIYKLLSFNYKYINFLIAFVLAKLVKISFVFGSYAAFFSLANSVTPLAGLYFGSFGALLFGFLKIIFGCMVTGKMFSMSYLAFYVPGMVAGLCWSASPFLMRFLCPFICIILFISHPQGHEAWLYSMYWLIPMIAFIFKLRGKYATALTSSFVAHAVGSVIWIYSVPMVASQWMALIPVVFIERVLFALGMVFIVYLHSLLKRYIKYVARPLFLRIRIA